MTVSLGISTSEIKTSGPTLEEIRGALAHTRVDISLGCLDVVVEVVSECLDMRNDFALPLRRQVPGEED